MGRPVKYPMTKGLRYGRFTVIKQFDLEKGKRRRVKALCDCGNVKIVYSADLGNGQVQSCGCLRNERVKAAVLTHGYAGTRLYGIYCNVIERCYNKNNGRYKDYGGRGIKMSKSWRHGKGGKPGFSIFLSDMGEPPSDKHTLDRIDNSKGYNKYNCRWVTYTEQANNKRNNRYFTFRGETLTASGWSRKVNLPSQAILGRMDYGWSVKKALTTPLDLKISRSTKRGMARKKGYID